MKIKCYLSPNSLGQFIEEKPNDEEAKAIIEEQKV
jgi:hypothetical protein